MANTAAPFGLADWQSAMGAAPTFEEINATVSSSDGTAIGYGDPVKKLSTGYVSRWTATTAVSQLAGIFVSCRYFSTSQQQYVVRNYWPGSDATGDVTVKLVPCNLAAPGRFLIQSDATGVAFADIGANCDVNMGTVNTTTGFSGAYLDTGTLNTTATLPFRILNILGVGGENAPIGPNGTNGLAAGAYNLVIVAANVSGAGSTGI